MDPLKDTKENKGVPKGQNSPHFLSKYERFMGQKDIEKLGHLFKRTQKIATAVYLVTDIISLGEPIRLELRKNSMSLHNTIWRTAREQSSREQSLIELEHLAGEIAGLLGIALTSRLVSPMNHSLIIESLDLFRSECAAYAEELYRSIYMAPEVSYIPRIGNLTRGTATDDKGQDIKDINISNGQIPSVIDISENKETFRKRIDIGLKINRRNSILKVVNEKKTVTIKDIKHILKDLSIKTIQREINALVSEGILQKTGDKRWSKYSVKRAS